MEYILPLHAKFSFIQRLSPTEELGTVQIGIRYFVELSDTLSFSGSGAEVLRREPFVGRELGVISLVCHRVDLQQRRIPFIQRSDMRTLYFYSCGEPTVRYWRCRLSQN